MRILIFGAGSLGSVLGALLSSVHDVSLITRGRHLEQIKKTGLKIEGISEGNFRLSAHEISDNLGYFDIIIVTTKAYDTENAAKSCEKILGNDTAIISIQNGIGNSEKLASIIDPERIVMGVTSMAAHRLDPGIVRYVAEGEILIGSPIPDSSAVEKAAHAISEAELPIRRTANITGAIWSKTIANAAINPLTAILGCRNGMIVENERLRLLAGEICEESMRIAAAKGIVLEPPDVAKYAIEIATNTAENRSSMLMDILKGHRTEIDSICSSILAASSEMNIDAPLISSLYSMVKFLEGEHSSQKA